METVEITVGRLLVEELLLSPAAAAAEAVDNETTVVVVVEVVVVTLRVLLLSFWLLVVGVARRGFKRLPPPTKLCSGNCIGDLLARGPIRGCLTAVVEVVADGIFVVVEALTSISKGSILSKFFLLMFSITSFMLRVPLCPEGGSNTGIMDRDGLKEIGIVVLLLVGVTVVVADFSEEDFSPTRTTVEESLVLLLSLLTSWVVAGRTGKLLLAWLATVMVDPALSELELTTEFVDLMITVCLATVAAADGVTEEGSADDKLLGVMTTEVLRGAEVDFTGETRTRRTLPSAETLTSLTGTILEPGGTK